MLEINKIYHGDCLEVLKHISDKSIDLIIVDPPYEIENTQTGSNSNFDKSFQRTNDQLSENKLNINLGIDWCKEVPRLQQKINIYIWCNKSQIIQYLDYFVKELNCSFDILNWRKINAVPTYNNKYLTDKEYCLYFKKGGYCKPIDYYHATTIWDMPINIKDKEKWKHPTIKPLPIIETLIKNSSKEGNLILDCFSGSGTTAVACYNLKRNFICIEKNEKFYKNSIKRLNETKAQLKIF